MLTCSDPVLLRDGAFACGRCAACLSKRRRTWAHRIIMEALQNAGRSTFVTLTYSDDQVPRNSEGFPTLEASHYRQFLKRLRKNAAAKVRYFVCGEYGEHTQRPHYHLALFGLFRCEGGPSLRQGKGVICVCPTCSVVRLSWGYGHTMVATLSEKSAMYIAGYVVKKMTSSSDPRLNGRAPEFARMSLKPGLGALALGPVVSALKEHKLPVPFGMRHGKKIMPFGRYLRRRIAMEISDGSEDGIRKALQTDSYTVQQLEAVRLLRVYAWSTEETPLDVLKQITPQSGNPVLKKGTL